MRVHRPHKKSRKGCVTCKTRRVKCDEKQPICTTCERRGTPCSYPASPVETYQGDITPSAESKPEGVQVDELSDALAEMAPIVRRFPKFLGDLSRIDPPDEPDVACSVLLSEYFQHAAVALTVADHTETRSKIYLDVIPSLASRHVGVSQAIFAVATISLAISQVRDGAQSSDWSYGTSPRHVLDNVSATHLRQAHRFYGRCLEELQENFTTLSEENADAVVASSALLIIFELSIAQLDRQRRRLLHRQTIDRPSSENAQCESRKTVQSKRRNLNLNWMKHIRGIGSFVPEVDARWPLRATEMRPFFQWPRRQDCVSLEDTLNPQIRSRLLTGDTSAVLRHPLLPTILAEGRTELARLRICIKASYQQDKSMLTLEADASVSISALDRLDAVVQYFISSSATESPQVLFRVFSAWVAGLMDSYLEQLSEEDEFALAVYSFFLVYMILFEDFWWVGDMGLGTLQDVLSEEYGYRQNCTLMGQMELKRTDLFQWPTRILELRKEMELCSNC